jgi:hypothetical protein
MAPRAFPALVGACDGDSWLVQEYVDMLSGYSIDMFVPAHALAIEVDGPSHFDWKGRRPLGARESRLKAADCLCYADSAAEQVRR